MDSPLVTKSRAVAVQAAKTTLKITTAPLHMWIKACTVLFHLVVLTLTTPKRLLQRMASSLNYSTGSKLSTKIDGVSEYSKALHRETRDLKLRLEAFENGLRNAEQLREDTFQEMRDIRSEVSQIFDAVQQGDKLNSSGRARKARYSRQNTTSSSADLRESSDSGASLPKWLTHASVVLALSMVWNFFIQGQFESSVERKLLLCLCCPMLWLYIQSTLRHKSDVADHFIIAIAWFVSGFICCAFFHPHKRAA